MKNGKVNRIVDCGKKASTFSFIVSQSTFYRRLQKFVTIFIVQGFIAMAF